MLCVHFLGPRDRIFPRELAGQVEIENQALGAISMQRWNVRVFANVGDFHGGLGGGVPHGCHTTRHHEASPIG